MPQAKRSYGRRKRSNRRKSSRRGRSFMSQLASTGKGQAARVKQLIKQLQEQYPNASKAVLAVVAADMLRRGYNYFAPEGYKKLYFQSPLDLQSPIKGLQSPIPGLRSPIVNPFRSPFVPNAKKTFQSPLGPLGDDESRFQNPYVDYKAPYYTEEVLPGKGPASKTPLRQIRRIFGMDKKAKDDGETMYGKRRRRRRRSFGKKASKKPSAATRRMCKKLKVKMTLKRGGKRVYKSEAMLKKQCKKAMKRKAKKSKK